MVVGRLTTVAQDQRLRAHVGCYESLPVLARGIFAGCGALVDDGAVVLCRGCIVAVVEGIAPTLYRHRVAT